MSIAVRPIQITDADAVNRLAAQLGYPGEVAETTRRISALLHREDHCLLVATEDENIIGWMHALETTWLETGRFAEIAGLIVDEKHRGKQAGEQLVNAAIQWCRERHCPRLCVRSNVLRTQAHRFYSKIGFDEIKESKVFEMTLQQP